MKNSHINFDINNLFAKKEVLISKEEIVEIVWFAIQNGIVNLHVDTMDVCNDDGDTIEFEDDGLMRLRFKDHIHNIMVVPFDHKKPDECSSCNDTGEIEVPRGSSSHFIPCSCQTKD